MNESIQEKVIFDGTISDERSMRVVFGLFCSSSVAQNALLRIVSRQARGTIGIFCNRYITGAHVSSTGAYGVEALKQLLDVSSGAYAFIQLPEQRIELVQNLALPLETLLSWRDPKDGSAGALSNAVVGDRIKARIFAAG